MRIAIFGGGSIGQRHAANARALGHEVKIFDKDESRGTNPLNGYAWTHFAPPDAAMICTPTATHEHVGRLLRNYGYAGPLFVEKPIALRSMAPVFLSWPHSVTMVGYNLRFHRATEYMRQVKPTSGQLTLLCDSRQWPGAGYAGLLEECSHEIDLAVHLGARPDVLGAVVSEHEADISLGPGDWRIHLNDRADRYWRRWDVFGETHGSSFMFGRPTDLGEAMYLEELRHFLLCVETGRPTLTPFSEGLRVLEICERVKELAA